MLTSTLIFFASTAKIAKLTNRAARIIKCDAMTAASRHRNQTQLSSAFTRLQCQENFMQHSWLCLQDPADPVRNRITSRQNPRYRWKSFTVLCRLPEGYLTPPPSSSVIWNDGVSIQQSKDVADNHQGLSGARFYWLTVVPHLDRNQIPKTCIYRSYMSFSN